MRVFAPMRATHAIHVQQARAFELRLQVDQKRAAFDAAILLLSPVRCHRPEEDNQPIKSQAPTPPQNKDDAITPTMKPRATGSSGCASAMGSTTGSVQASRRGKGSMDVSRSFRPITPPEEGECLAGEGRLLVFEICDIDFAFRHSAGLRHARRRRFNSDRMNAMRAAIYCRVSTVNQACDRQVWSGELPSASAQRWSPSSRRRPWAREPRRAQDARLGPQGLAAGLLILPNRTALQLGYLQCAA